MMTLKDVGKLLVTVFGIALTTQQLYDSGYNKGKSESQTLTEIYKARQEESEKKTKDAEQEVTSLKLELQRAVEKPITRERSTPDTTLIEKKIESQTKQGISLSLEAGQTKSPFDNELYVSLVSITYIGSPPSHVATIVLGHTGKQSLRIEDAAVGSVTEYEGYEVRVMATSTFSIGVQIKRIN